MAEDTYVIVLTTMPGEADALGLASELIEAGLAACVNVLPEMHSVYRWEGRVERGTERQLLIKTAAARVPALRARVEAAHPYELPELVEVPISGGSEAYLRWVGESVITANG